MKKLTVLLYSFLFFILVSPVLSSSAYAATNPADLVGVQVDYSKLYDFVKNKPIIQYGTINESHPEWLCKTVISSTTLLCGPATASFNAMNAAFKLAKGHDLSMSGGYRKKSDQIAGGGTVERPGGSNPAMAPYDPNKRPPEHGWGTAVDLSPGSAESVAWVKANGKKFGWFRPYWATDSVEYWHFQYYSSHHKGGNLDQLDADEKKGGVGPDGQANGGGGSSTATACAVTKVGNPLGQAVLPAECGASAGTGMIKVAHDLKNTLDKCTGGSTLNSKNNDTCTKADLKSKGYTDKQISAYISRRDSSDDGTGVECLGWVSNVVALLGGEMGASFGAGWAGDMIQKPELIFGHNTFSKVTLANGQGPQPGDIGVTLQDGSGHVLIVNKPQGSSSFVGIEANWTPYKVSEDKVHPNSRYTFFRKN